MITTEKPSKKKVFAVAITTVALTAGSFGVAQASQKSTKVSRTTISTIGNPGQAGKPDRSAQLTALLATLVSKGTITQAQADAIVAAHTASDAAREGLRSAKGALKGDRDARLALIATTLGIDTTTVVTRLKAGESLATIAGAKKDALITALVADESKRIDAAVTAGKITADQAATLKANLVAHVTDEVNSVRSMMGKGGKDRMHGDRDGKGGRGGDQRHGRMGGSSSAPKIPAPTPSATTSSN